MRMRGLDAANPALFAELEAVGFRKEIQVADAPAVSGERKRYHTAVTFMRFDVRGGETKKIDENTKLRIFGNARKFFSEFFFPKRDIRPGNRALEFSYEQ